jgi:hypothetical protein
MVSDRSSIVSDQSAVARERSQGSFVEVTPRRSNTTESVPLDLDADVPLVFVDAPLPSVLDVPLSSTPRCAFNLLCTVIGAGIVRVLVAPLRRVSVRVCC